MIIYNKDGSTKEIDEEKVQVINLSSDTIYRIYNFLDGVKIEYKNSKDIFIENATTDGVSINIG